MGCGASSNLSAREEAFRATQGGVPRTQARVGFPGAQAAASYPGAGNQWALAADANGTVVAPGMAGGYPGAVAATAGPGGVYPGAGHMGDFWQRGAGPRGRARIPGGAAAAQTHAAHHMPAVASTKRVKNHFNLAKDSLRLIPVEQGEKLELSFQFDADIAGEGQVSSIFSSPPPLSQILCLSLFTAVT